MTGKAPPSIGLLKVPNEILGAIASLLRPADLRKLGQVNCRLYSFVQDYLNRFWYNNGLTSLPTELLLEIVEHLGSQAYRSRLAKASARLYLPVMDHIIRHDVRHGGSRLLIYACERNLKGMARRILHRGGDVNAQGDIQSGTRDKRLTPLTLAAFYGHERIVRMLLEAGASHVINGERVPLAAAILKKHEAVALILTQDLHSSNEIIMNPNITALQMACKAKLVNLVRYYLDRGSPDGRHMNVSSHTLQDRSTSLYLILREDATKDRFIKRDLHEDVYQIVLILLHHGANPDVQIKTKLSNPVTIRAIASKHPDPRLRALLANAKSVVNPRKSNALIGRPWLGPPKRQVCAIRGLPPEQLPSGVGRYAALSDFLEHQNAEPWSMMYENEVNTDNEHSSNFADLNAGTTPQPQKKPEAVEPPSLSLFPPLGTQRVHTKPVSKEFWANRFTRPSFVDTLA